MLLKAFNRSVESTIYARFVDGRLICGPDASSIYRFVAADKLYHVRLELRKALFKFSKREHIDMLYETA
jgi:hypothetical protein